MLASVQVAILIASILYILDKKQGVKTFTDSVIRIATRHLNRKTVAAIERLNAINI